MAKLDICTCLVDLNEFTTVARTELNPLNYAEVEMLRFTIGERAIRDLKVIRTVEAENQEVLQRLRMRYSNRQVSEAFPGTRPRLPMQAPSDVPRLEDEDEGDDDGETPTLSAAAIKKRAQRAKAKAAQAAETVPQAPEPLESDVDLGDVFETAGEN